MFMAAFGILGIFGLAYFGVILLYSGPQTSVAWCWLVFAGFCEFYDNDATEKILRLANMLSPEIFKYWHIVPRRDEIEYAAFKQHINTKVIAERLN